MTEMDVPKPDSLEKLMEDLPALEVESLEEAFVTRGEVPLELQEKLRACFPDDVRFQNPLGRYLCNGLNTKLIRRPDMELQPDILEENRWMMEGEVSGKLPWLVVYAHLKFCREVLGDSFQKLNATIAQYAVDNCEWFKNRQTRRVYIDFDKLFAHPEVQKFVHTALQNVTYELVKNYKSSKGKTYLKRLPLECREHVQDETLSYWVEDFERELTESEVGLWVKCVVDYAKSQGG